MQTPHTKELFNEIRLLSPEKIAVVEDFVEFLRHSDEIDTLVNAAGKLSEKSCQHVWDNLEDGEDDTL